MNMKASLILIGSTFTIIANAQVNMIQVGSIYVDIYEAPNLPNGSPFVMFNYNEAESWCQARGKRLLSDDEWELVASGPNTLPYVYGALYDSSICNDDETWMPYNQSELDQWPASLPYLNSITSFTELIDSVSQVSSSAAQSADEVMSLYQAEYAGANTACISTYGVFDMNGNVSEWTTRSDGGVPNFHGNLKGGYWADPVTIQSDVTAHSDVFRHYYTGFRCAMDADPTTIQTEYNAESLVVYPNPATTHVTIATTDKAWVELYSIEGSSIKVINCTGPQTKIGLQSLSTGFYILRVMTDKKTITRKIVKE